MDTPVSLEQVLRLFALMSDNETDVLCMNGKTSGQFVPAPWREFSFNFHPTSPSCTACFSLRLRVLSRRAREEQEEVA